MDLNARSAWTAALIATAIALAGFRWGDSYPSHPVLLNARNQLQGAKRSLEHATHDCGGHRTQTMQLIDSALAELEKGMSYADAHPDDDQAKR